MSVARSRKEGTKIPLARFNMLLLLWGTISSVMVLLSFLVYGFYSPSEAPDISAGRILFAYVILAAIVGGALSASIHIARKS